jgi:lipoprotein NlpD
MTSSTVKPAITKYRDRAVRLAAGALLVLLAACATRVPAPVEERSRPPAISPPAVTAPAPPPVATPPAETDWRPPTYTVKRGDTLQAIALEHGLDYRDLAVWNNIENVNRILVGQVLRLGAPGDTGPADAGATTTSGVTTAPLRTVPPVVAGDTRPPASPPATPLIVPGQRNADTYKAQPKALKEPYSEQALRDFQRIAALPSPPTAASAPGTMPAPSAATSPSAIAHAAPPAAASPSTGSAAAAPASTSTPPSTTPGVASPLPSVVPAPGLPPAAEPALVARAEPRVGPKPEPRAEAKSAPAADDDGDRIAWLWPATGKIVTGFSDSANLKGIDIAGKLGQPVIASAAGKVVYAGTGLRGYGKLVIVKHNNTFLSAYAHNKDLLVTEGQQVTRGQKIAEMGNSDSDQVKLHFEIRKLGKPVDPLKYLPPG